MHHFSNSSSGAVRLVLVVFIISCIIFSSTRSIVRAAGASISLLVNSGPPTTQVKVSGSGFGVSEKVIILFDTTSVGTGKTNTAGTFAKTIVVPASALPGNHTIQATGQTSHLSAQATYLVRTNWTMFGFNPQHTHLNPYENVLSTGNVLNLSISWQTALGGFVDQSSPVVANGVLYVGADDNNLFAIDIQSHVILWTYALPISSAGSPVVANGLVYIGADRLYALNATSGALVWKSANYTYVFAPTLANNLLYFGTWLSGPCAYTLTGHKRWCSGQAGSTNTAPAVINGILYAGSPGNDVFAVNASTGALLWTYLTGGNVDCSPAVVNGMVYIGSGDNTFYALNATTGAKVWSYTTTAPIDSSPAVVNGIVYFGSGYPDNTFYALDAATGAKVWSYKNVGGAILAPPTLANGVVYIGTNDHILYAFNASTGAMLWNYTVSGYISTEVVIADGVVYAGSGYPTPNVYAFHLPV